jgi:HTH-type transcriptional regulator/antitoxin HigA
METRNENPTPWIATHPGIILKLELEERGISQKEFAEMLDIQKSHLNEIIKGKRPMTNSVADKIEDVLSISSVSLMNLQTQYEYDLRQIESRSIEEQEAINKLKLFDEIFDVKTLLKRLGCTCKTSVEKLRCLIAEIQQHEPAELKLEANGMFKKSSKTGQDPRMLMTWKLLAEATVRKIKPFGVFQPEKQDSLVKELTEAFHQNRNTINTITRVFSKYGIAFCVVKKVEKASIDGYSFIDNNIPYVVVTERFDRIDNLAFAVLHEVGHVFLHYLDGTQKEFHLSIPDYDNESLEEREANAFAANALISSNLWKNAPKVRVNPLAIQKTYTDWASVNGFNKWIVLGRISYETGMYKFKSDDSRRIN